MSGRRSGAGTAAPGADPQQQPMNRLPLATDAPPARARLASLARWAEAGLLGVCLLYAIVFWLRLPGRLPSEDDYLKLQAALQQSAQPGDAVAVLPFWAQRARVYVRGWPVLALPQLEREPDVERYRRLFVIAQPQLPRSDAAETLAGLRARLDVQGSPLRFGPLELWSFAPKPTRAASYDLTAHWRDATVVSGYAPRLEWREFDFLPRHCLVGSGPVQLRFDGVVLERGIRLGLGGQPGAGARAQVAVDDRPLPPMEWGADAATNGAHFQTAELLAEGLTPGTHQVTLAWAGQGSCLDAVAF